MYVIIKCIPYLSNWATSTGHCKLPLQKDVCACFYSRCMQWTRHSANLHQAIAKGCLALSVKSLVGAADGGGGALPCRCTKEEGAHQIREPSDPWQRVGGGVAPSCIGGGAAPGPAITRRRRGVILPCHHAQEEGARQTKRHQLRWRGEFLGATVVVVLWRCNEEREVIFLCYLSPPLQK
jgi:hypothetical protein